MIAIEVYPVASDWKFQSQQPFILRQPPPWILTNDMVIGEEEDVQLVEQEEEWLLIEDQVSRC